MINLMVVRVTDGSIRSGYCIYPSCVSLQPCVMFIHPVYLPIMCAHTPV